MTIKNIIIVVFIAILSACTIEESAPEQGPNGSFWVGGMDGGVFLKVEDDSDSTDDIFLGTIYFETDLDIWYEGRLKLVGLSADQFSPEDYSVYAGWDGETLHLKDGPYLKAMDPIPPL